MVFHDKENTHDFVMTVPVNSDIYMALSRILQCHNIHSIQDLCSHDNVIKWKHFPRYWPFVRGIHRSPVNSPHKSQWRGALIYSLICVWINEWVNNRETGDLRRYRAHYYVTLSGKTSYRQMSWRLEAARLDVIMIASLLNLIGISAALLSRWL